MHDERCCNGLDDANDPEGLRPNIFKAIICQCEGEEEINPEAETEIAFNEFSQEAAPGPQTPRQALRLNNPREQPPDQEESCETNHISRIRHQQNVCPSGTFTTW